MVNLNNLNLNDDTKYTTLPILDKSTQKSIERAGGSISYVPNKTYKTYISVDGIILRVNEYELIENKKFVDVKVCGSRRSYDTNRLVITDNELLDRFHDKIHNFGNDKVLYLNEL
jgi:hypothetical protein